MSILFTCSFLLAQNSPEHKAELKKDEAEVQSFTLTMETVKRAVETTKAMQDAVKADPELQKKSKQNEADEEQASLSQMATMISSSAKLSAIVVAHGFTPRKYALAELSIVQTAIAVAGIQAGATVGDMIKGGGNADNIKLFQDHKAELDELFKKYPMGDSD